MNSDNNNNDNRIIVSKSFKLVFLIVFFMTVISLGTTTLFAIIGKYSTIMSLCSTLSEIGCGVMVGLLGGKVLDLKSFKLVLVAVFFMTVISLGTDILLSIFTAMVDVGTKSMTLFIVGSGAMVGLLVGKESLFEVLKMKQFNTNKNPLEKQILDYNFKQNKRIYLFSSIYIFCVTIVFILNNNFFANIKNWLIYISISIIAPTLITIKVFILKYRIYKDFYGTTKEDFYEIIEYIFDNISDIDDGTGTFSKKCVEKVKKVKEKAEKEGIIFG